MIFEWIYRLGSFLNQTSLPVQAINTMQSTPPAQGAPPAHSLNVLIIFLQIIYFIICLGLIAAVMSQTTKSEGLSGMMGGATQSIFRGKKSIEEKIGTITTWLAGGFLAASFLIFFLIRNAK
jgi:preprotein translocase subunit SecG